MKVEGKQDGCMQCCCEFKACDCNAGDMQKLRVYNTEGIHG